MQRCPNSSSPARRRPRLLLFVLALVAATAAAHETDNFHLPLDVPMADLGAYLENQHATAIEEAVRKTNQRIETALRIQDPRRRQTRLAELHDPMVLAEAVARVFGSPLTETERLTREFRSPRVQEAFPGLATTHRGLAMNMAAHFPLDLRWVYMVFQADTIKAYGIYFGTDKLTHFHHLGWLYYKYYHRLIRDGVEPAEAHQRMLRHFSRRTFLAEGRMFGTIGTGVFSNADLCANLLGFKFYMNLTQPTRLKGRNLEPLVARAGDFWRVADHVRREPGWWAAYVSDHWNEALNPSLYDATMRPGIRRILESRAEAIVRFYTERDGRPKSADYFHRLALELSTYDGESYGHSGQWDKLMHIGNTCLPALERHPTAQEPARKNRVTR